MKKISRREIELQIDDLMDSYDDLELVAMCVMLKETINRLVADRKVSSYTVMEYELDTIARVTPIAKDYMDRYIENLITEAEENEDISICN